MKRIELQKVLTVALIASSIAMVIGCDTAASNSGTPTDEDYVAAVRMDFEAAQFGAVNAAGGFVAEAGDVNATWGTAGTATNDIVFSSDTATFDSGAASLKATATALQNKYSSGTAQWSFNIDLSKVAGIATPIDLTDKAVSLKVLIPAATTLTGAKLVFRDNTGKQSQGTATNITVKDAWSTVSYLFGGTTDYTETGFDVTKVVSISVVAIKVPAAANSPSQTMYFDALGW